MTLFVLRVLMVSCTCVAQVNEAAAWPAEPHSPSGIRSTETIAGMYPNIGHKHKQAPQWEPRPKPAMNLTADSMGWQH